MDLNKIGLLLFLLIGVNFAGAQVKIGENPNNIDAASIVELESTTKAFVLTRVSTIQMQGITPLYGAMVYNTETKCIHFFDGTTWNNLCNNASTGTGNAIVVVNANGTFTFSNGIDSPVTFYGSAETTSTLVNNFDGTYTYTDENGGTTIISSNLSKTDIETMGFVDGDHTIDTDTHLTNTEVAAAATAEGFVTGAHTVDTNLSKTDIETMGFVDGAHTIDTNTQLSNAEVAAA
ncbi:MAG: hypothetical protein WBM53_08050, partial [Maribacter sp.]